MERKRKGIAPEEHGEFPNEKRCRNCWRLLSKYEDQMTGQTRLWCMHCQTFYAEPKEKG